MAWSGSFLVLSILAHVILLGGATVLVVQVVQGRKEKMKFTAPPPSAAGAAEHKVKPSKKTAAAAPAISKRIASTAANASIALPAMDMNASTGPDVMASVMSGLGSAGLGSGAGGAGAGGMASMPLAGLTAFGFKGGNSAGGLRGQIYDLKQTPDHKPTEIPPEHGLSTPDGRNPSVSVVNQLKLFADFFRSGWDEKLLEKYYRAKDPVVAYRVLVPYMRSMEGPKAFGVEKEIPDAAHWCCVYRGTVITPKDGTYRFVGFADDQMAVRFNDQNVFFHTLQNPGKEVMEMMNGAPEKNPNQLQKEEMFDRMTRGKWFTVSAGKAYPIQILIAEMPGGVFTAQLYIEERYPEKPYPLRTFPGAEKFRAYPVFQLKKELPMPKREVVVGPPPNAPANWRPSENYHETAPNPVVFTGK